MANDFSPSARRKARRLVLQALYQWHMNENSTNEIETQFLVNNDMGKVDREYFRDVLHGVPTELELLNAEIENFLDRSLKELTPIELTILRMGCYELMHRLDVPYKVIINEGVELAKSFGANEGHRYVNGVLDKMAQKLRIAEVKH